MAYPNRFNYLCSYGFFAVSSLFLPYFVDFLLHDGFYRLTFAAIIAKSFLYKSFPFKKMYKHK